MREITVTPELQRRAKAYLDWFPTFCVSSSYEASMDWPEVAHTVASAILNTEVGTDLTIANYRADAWRHAGFLLDAQKEAES